MNGMHRWWNHEDHELKVKLVNGKNQVVIHRIPPGGSIQLDDGYTRKRVDDEGNETFHVRHLSPHLKYDPPPKAKRAKDHDGMPVDPTVEIQRRRANPDRSKVKSGPVNPEA